LTLISQCVIILLMIKSFRDKEAEKIFNRFFSGKLPRNIHNIARKKLIIVDAVTEIDDLSVPAANRLKALKGARKGQHSIRINNQWRICFKWKDGDSYDVQITDYH
jgi:proteic killer suppression protein